MSLKFNFRRASLIIFALIVLLFIAARVWRLSSVCLWFDEIFSVHAAHHSWSEMMRFVAADLIHPPLFYALLKIWISIGGESVLWLRLLPALLSILSIVPFVLLCRELKLRQADINLALLLLAVNGYLIKYAQEVRMYSLLLLLSLFSFWLFFRLLNCEKKAPADLILLGACNLLMVYSHYAGWFVVAFQALTIAIWYRRLLAKYLLSVAALIAAYAPWIYLLTTSAAGGTGLAQNIGWVVRPRLIDLIQYFVLLNRPFLFSQSSADLVYFRVSAFLALLIFGFPILFFVWRIIQKNELDGQARQPILDRPGFSAGPPGARLHFKLVVALFGVGNTSLNRRVAVVFDSSRAVVEAFANVLAATHHVYFIGVLHRCDGTRVRASTTSRFHLVCMGTTWRATTPREQQQDIPVYAFEDLVAYHLWFSFDSAHATNFNVSVVKGAPGIEEDPAYFLPRRFDEIKTTDSPGIRGDRIFVAFRALRWDESEAPLNLLRNAGYRVVSTSSLPAQGQQAFLVELRTDK